MHLDDHIVSDIIGFASTTVTVLITQYFVYRANTNKIDKQTSAIRTDILNSEDRVQAGTAIVEQKVSKGLDVITDNNKGIAVIQALTAKEGTTTTTGKGDDCA